MRKEQTKLTASGTNNNSQSIPKNIKSSKTLNILRALEYIREHNAATPAELSQNTEIPIASTYRILQNMREAGLVTCIEKQESSGGRRAGLYSVDPNYKHMLGIYIAKRHLSIFIVNMFGEIVDMSRETYPTDCTADDFVEMIDKGVGKITKTCYGRKNKMTHISFAGVVAEAAVDANEGVIVEFDGLSCLNGFEIRSFIEKKYKINTYIMKYVHLAACIYSKDMAAANVRDYIYVSAGIGIGASVVINGMLHEGAQSNAGELGTLLSNLSSYWPSELYRDVEKYLQRPENAALYKELQEKEPDMSSNGTAMMKCIEALVERGDEFVVKKLENAAESIAKLGSILVGFYDPQAVIIGGDISKAIPRVWECILGKINKYNGIRCSVMPSYLGKTRLEMTAMRLVDYAYESIYTELVQKQ